MTFDFDEIAAEHNWSKDTMLAVLQDFIYENDLDDKLGQFADEVAKAQNGAIHYLEEEEPTPYDFDEDPDADSDTYYDEDPASQEDWSPFNW